MKLKIFMLCFTLAVCSASVFAADAQDEKAAMDDAMMKMAAPGDQHKWLASFEGKWDITVKNWMVDPGKPPEETKGNCESHMILGGRFLHQECTGTMMGKPFNGMGITGYDNAKKKYINAWMDNFGTMILTSEGTETGPGKEVTFMSSMDDPMMGPMQMRQVIRVIDANSYTYEMYATPKEGKEVKGLEITYTRSK
jgi:Protein of unknown function (DUF1579)